MQPLSILDLRSDTVTQPNEAMREAMAKAVVGDDVYEEDPTCRSLEERVADLLGKEAGLFFPSGTQSNLCAMLTHCQRGQEIITGEHYHVFGYEARGASVLGGVSLHPLRQETGGWIAPQCIAAAIKPDDSHFPQSTLLSLENTHYGKVIPLEQCLEMANIAKQNSLKVHLDGARLANAAIGMKTSIEGACFFADSVSFCLSKGLGAPAGSVLVGPKNFIDRARRLRKMLGGSMRQVGILAAAGHYALDEHLPDLEADHHLAALLDQLLVDTDKLHVMRECTQTNMLYLNLPNGGIEALTKYLKEKNIVISGENSSLRLVMHHDLCRKDISYIAAAINQWAQ